MAFLRCDVGLALALDHSPIKQIVQWGNSAHSAKITPPSFGTSVGLPHVNLDGREMPNDGDLVDLLQEWVPDSATRNRILVDNPCTLYGFPPAAKAAA
jgi:hypothetical protein